MRTLIIGGGLSGLALADTLETAGQDYLLVEGRNRFGGRIMTQTHGGGYFDMGPAWFWPGQPRIAKLAQRFELEVFDQYAKGDLLFEDQDGQVQRGRGFSSMEGSWRLKGGMQALIHALSENMPKERYRLGASITALENTGSTLTATLASSESVVASRVVFALPPRLVAQVRFTPSLPAPALNAMQGVDTWMAGQAKALAVYDTPFWRDAGLSGDASSRFGPMVEMHDACPAAGGPYGLFGFIGVPPTGRTDEHKLRLQVSAQLTRLFGPAAAEPDALFVKDWAYDTLTSTPTDREPLRTHPEYGLPDAMKGIWDGKLLFAGTEVAGRFGGYLEGALEAAETVLSDIVR